MLSLHALRGFRILSGQKMHFEHARAKKSGCRYFRAS
jgi:hypothetical protein